MEAVLVLDSGAKPLAASAVEAPNSSDSKPSEGARHGEASEAWGASPERAAIAYSVIGARLVNS